MLDARIATMNQPPAAIHNEIFFRVTPNASTVKLPARPEAASTSKTKAPSATFPYWVNPRSPQSWQLSPNGFLLVGRGKDCHDAVNPTFLVGTP
jgi:hypothetical protein